MGRIVTAEYRSRQFLLEHLNWWQRFTYRVRGGFRVRGSVTRNRYWIDRRGVHRFPWFYCLYVYEYNFRTYQSGDIPVADAMLAKKILIGAEERLFLATAVKR